MSKGLLFCMLIMLGCSEPKPKPRLPSKEEMEEMNRISVKREALQIQQFVGRMGWPTVKTGSGLHYYIYEQGQGEPAKTGDEVVVRMIITLLNGDTCYSWTRYGDERFIVERADNESGLHEAIQFLNKGSKAKIILPSYLAFGVAGDRDKIPPRSSVVYDLHLVDIR